MNRTGFLSAVVGVLSVVEGGLVWLAPVCASFVWMNSSNTKRRKGHEEGDESYTPVHEGNLQAQVAGFLMALA